MSRLFLSFGIRHKMQGLFPSISLYIFPYLRVSVTLPFYNDNASEFFTKNSSFDSVGNSTELPLDMRFNDGHLLSVVSYGVLFVVSTTGNFTVFFLLLQRRRGSRSRINTMLLHLAIADLLVG
jgi:hypothetical protein